MYDILYCDSIVWHFFLWYTIEKHGSQKKEMKSESPENTNSVFLHVSTINTTYFSYTHKMI